MWTLLIPLILAEIASSFEVSMIYAGLPTLHKHFANPIGVGWVITSCFLVSAVAAALCGRLGDLYGRRMMIIVILVLCASGSLISGFSSTLGWVVVGASIQGLSGAVLPLAVGLTREALPKEKVPLAIGIVMAALALGSGLGLLVGGAIVDLFSWNAIFFTSATMALAGALSIWALIPASVRQTAPREGIDMFTGILFAPAIGGILFAVGKSREWGWGDARIHGIIVASLLVLAFWAWHQARQKNPLIDVRLFTNRKIVLAYGAMAMVALGPMQLGQMLSLFLQQPTWTMVGFGLSATMAGLIMLPTHWSGLIVSPLSGKIAGLFGARTAGIIGASMIVSGWIVVVLAHSSLWVVMVAIFWAHVGFITVYAAVPNMVVEAAPPERTSEAAGIATVSRALFMAIGAQMVTLIMASSTVTDPARGPTHYATDAAYTMLFTYVAIVSALCLLCFLLVPGRKRSLPGGVPVGGSTVAGH